MSTGRFFATTDGYVVVKGSNGYCYVSALDVSGSGDSGVWAHNEDERGLSEELWLNANGTTSENFMAFAASSRAAIETRALGTSDNPQGEVTYPVILVNFSDVSFSITNAVDTFNRQFNEKRLFGRRRSGKRARLFRGSESRQVFAFVRCGVRLRFQSRVPTMAHVWEILTIRM